MNERDIFHAAAEFSDPAQRSAYLEQACAGNPSLKQHVEEMLQVYPELGAFLESPAVDLPGTAEPPHNAGRFQLGGELARGGMGVIYRARDEALGRDVAVKVLHERYRDDSLMGQRFLDEARITAQLQHPGIPPVFEVGRLADGRPYLAMKLIKGRTLQELLNERSTPASDRGRFLAMFEQICQAVGYAHSHRVLHRDLKPDNVMVGAFGEVQVMDWGVAKLLAPGAAVHEIPAGTDATCGTVIQTSRERDSATLTGSVVGTPAFMAPEQAGGELDRLDERTDVFGLGAILCVLLTGEPPYTAKSRESLRLMAVRGVLAGAHARLEQCGADAKLVELCRACLSVDQERRPPDAGAVATAVHDYLAGVEERARQAETERAEALVREAEQRKRRRTVQVAAVAVAVVLLAGLSVSLWQMFRAQGAEVQANTNAQKAQDEGNAKDVALKAEQKARADETKARQQAFAALRSMTADVVERKFTQGTVLTEDDRAFLRRIIEQFDAFAAIKGDDADSRAVRAEGRFRVGNIRISLGELKEAEKDYDQALTIQKQLSAHFPERPEFRRELAQTYNNRGSLLSATGRRPAAEKDYDQALSIRKELSAHFPARAEYRQDLAKSYNNRGHLLNATGRPKEAETDYAQALSLFKQLSAQFPSRAEFRERLAMSYNNRGVLLSTAGRFKEAEEDYDQALSLFKRLSARFPARAEFREQLAMSYNNRGNLLLDQGRVEGVQKYYDQALSIRKQLAADFPSRPEFRHMLAAALNNRGALLSTTSRPKEAEQDYEQALSICKQLSAQFPTRPEFRQELARSHMNRGDLLSDMGRLPEAEKDYDQALSIRKQLSAHSPNQPDLHNDLAATCVNLAILRHQQGNWAAAKQLLLEGRPHHLAVLKANPEHRKYRLIYRYHLNVLTGVHAGLLEPEDAVRTAETRRDLGWDAPADAYDAACNLSQCVSIVGKHDKLNNMQRKDAARFYGDAAMKLLHDAVSKGFKDVTHMKKDTDLNPLRQREDFQKLVAELERKGK